MSGFRQKAAGGDVRSIDDDAWAEAKRQARALDKVLDGMGARRTLMARAASELNLTTRQVYNLLERYARERMVSALLSRRNERRVKRLSAIVETIIADTLRSHWLVLEAPPLAPVVQEIRARCAVAAERQPSYGAIQQRIPLLFDPVAIAKGRSVNPAHVRRLKARPGYIAAPRPLAVCQIDHTPTDIQFVEVINDLGTFIGRAWLTIVADVFSRAILGFCLTLEKPGSLSVALCMAQVLCPKEPWLSAHGLGDHDSPMFGRPETLVVDGAKEFKGNAFARGCKEYGIAIRPRHRGNVHQGGVVERLLGTLNGLIGHLPGKTGRSVADRDDYPSETKARLSFAELERCVALAVLDHNSHQNQKTLVTPLLEWRNHMAEAPRHNDDPFQTLINFLPGGERRLTPQGVSVHAIDYFAPWLGELVPERDRIGKLEMRTDPRDLSHIYLRHPRSRTFLPVVRRDGNETPITLWEHERARTLRRAPEANLEMRRAIPAIVAGARAPSRQPALAAPNKSALRAAACGALARAVTKPFDDLAVEPSRLADAPTEHRRRPRRRLPVEEW